MAPVLFIKHRNSDETVTMLYSTQAVYINTVYLLSSSHLAVSRLKTNKLKVVIRSKVPSLEGPKGS